MSQSESILSLAAALAKAQPRIDGAMKDSANPFFKSKYADLASVTAAVQPIHQFGLCYIQRSHDRPDAAAIETIILHSSGEWMSAGIVSVPVSKQDAQGYGSALTYARRYSLGAAFGIVPEDDDGNAAAKAAPAKAGAKITPRGGMYESLSPDMQVWVTDKANNVRTLLSKDDERGAWAELTSDDLELDEITKGALWDRFDSKERSRLTKIAEQIRKAA